MNSKGESFGKTENGKKTWEIERDKYLKFIVQKYKEGWRKTVVGFLPPDEIKKAGLKWNNLKEKVWRHGKWIEVPRGYDAIPTQTYIQEERCPERNKGTKYVGVSQQFLKWQEEYNNRNKSKSFLKEKQESIDNFKEVFGDSIDMTAL